MDPRTNPYARHAGIGKLVFVQYLSAMLVYSVASLALAAPPRPVQDSLVSRIAFGSCAHQDRPQPIWQRINALSPELFVFLGDNIYADTQDMVKLKAKYERLAQVPGYQQLRANVPIAATWDDHDYGANDAGGEFPLKADSQRVFLEFFEEPVDSPRWKQNGVYTSYLFGPSGKRLQLILLDTRYSRDPLNNLSKVPGTVDFAPSLDPKATVLGLEQWQWLEKQLKLPADVRLIGSSIQVLSKDHHYEKWFNFPKERERLLGLLEKSTGQVIILSGDRHFAELSQIKLNKDQVLYDLTSSGINQGKVIQTITEANRHRVATYSQGNHFGWIQIDWTSSPPKIQLEIRDQENRPVISQALSK